MVKRSLSSLVLTALFSPLLLWTGWRARKLFAILALGILGALPGAAQEGLVEFPLDEVHLTLSADVGFYHDLRLRPSADVGTSRFIFDEARFRLSLNTDSDVRLVTVFDFAERLSHSPDQPITEEVYLDLPLSLGWRAEVGMFRIPWLRDWDRRQRRVFGPHLLEEMGYFEISDKGVFLHKTRGQDDFLRLWYTNGVGRGDLDRGVFKDLAAEVSRSFGDALWILRLGGLEGRYENLDEDVRLKRRLWLGLRKELRNGGLIEAQVTETTDATDLLFQDEMTPRLDPGKSARGVHQLLSFQTPLRSPLFLIAQYEEWRPDLDTEDKGLLRRSAGFRWDFSANLLASLLWREYQFSADYGQGVRNTEEVLLGLRFWL